MSSEILITFIVTSSIAATLTIMRYLYKYKFTSCSFCGGCLKLERNVLVEQKLDEIEANKPTPEETKKESNASDTSTLTTASLTDTANNSSSSTISMPTKINNVMNLSSMV